jgi:myosin heavy subunit
MTVTYRGNVAELQGKKFEVPADVPIEKAAAYIEEQHQAMKETAAAEQLDRAVKQQQATQRKTKKDEQIAALQGRINKLEGMLEALERDNPDLVALAQVSSNLGNLIYNANQTQKQTEADQIALQATQAATEEALLQAMQLAEEAKKVNAETLATLKANQTITSQAFNSYGSQLQKFRVELTEVEIDQRLYVEQMQQNAETVRQAANIKEEATNIARLAAQDEIQMQQDILISSVNLMMSALGLDKPTVMQALNAQEVTKKPIITAAELAMAVTQHLEGEAIQADAEDRINEQSAASTLNSFTA